jgi:hypothetical protein
LKGYDGIYKDKYVFLTFVTGIILGIISVAVRIGISPPVLLIVFIIIFAFFEQLFKTIILNIGPLQRKKETTIYGLSLGLGFGSVFTPFLLIAAYINGITDTHVMSLIAFGSIGIILFHGATGAYIGYGVYTGNKIKYALISIMLQLPLNVVTDLTRVKDFTSYSYLFQITLVIYGGLIFWYVVKKIMPKILEQNRIRSKNKAKINKEKQ